jgi:hypothetical protein
MRTDILPISKSVTEITSDIPEIVLPRFPADEIKRLDLDDRQHGRVPKNMRNIVTKINPENSGRWDNLPDGSKIWRVKISSTGALALCPVLDSLFLPNGSTLHFYNNDGTEILGAYTNENTPRIRAFSPGFIHGENFVIEYYQPAGQMEKALLDIYRVGYGYRDVARAANQVDTLSNCEVNVTCPEGDNWTNQIMSVVKIYIVANSSGYYCSGALVNNTRKDGTPYILSAQHCLEGATLQSDFDQWIFTFHYQDSSCNGSGNYPGNEINGCTEIANSNDQQGTYGSDFLLLKLSSLPTEADSAYYAGWNNGAAIPQSGVGIHHPGGDVKKISTYAIPAVSTTWGDNVPNTHWAVTWDTSIVNHGITEPGSSGSPLFDENGLIVGHLTGGSSCCQAGACLDVQAGGDPWGPDYYGKVAHDWTLNGDSAYEQLKPWLDPDNTGAVSLPGSSFLTSVISPAPNNDLYMKLEPNPTAGLFKVMFNTSEEKDILIFDALGRNIIRLQSQGLNVVINLSAYSKGIYIIEAGNENARSIEKLVLN